MDSNNKQIATWLNKGYAEKLVKVAQSYWDNTKDWVLWAVKQKNEQESADPILGLLAWERLTDRLPTEPMSLYRKRVQHALVNTVEAGEIASIQDVFARLGIDVLRVRERIDGQDWDIIALDLTNETVSEYGAFLPELIQLYGRTCRRYQFSVHNKADIGLAIGSLDVSFDSTWVNEGLTLQQNTETPMNNLLGHIGAQYQVHMATMT